jgi:flagellin-like protein
MRDRKGVSPVISTVILSACVLVIGGMIWSYSVSATSVIASNYINETLEVVNDVTERFIVEHVQYISANDTISVWVYNYGEQTITIDTYLYVDTNSSSFQDQYSGTVVHKSDTEKIMIQLSESVSTGDLVSIQLHSRRQNDAYKKYYIP